MRIVFFGTPAFAVPTLQRLLESPHQVVGVVTQPDRPRGRGQKVIAAPVKALALAAQLPIAQPTTLRDPAVAETLRAWQPDLGVVAAYGKLIPGSLLSLPRFGMINVHASLLPRYRGAAPIHRAVIHGESETGVTIMRMAERLDAGDMIARVERPIGADDTSDAVERDLAVLGAALLARVVDDIAAGRTRETPQDERLSTYAPRLTKGEGLVDWTTPAAAIHNRVRGLYPWPHAYTYLEGVRLILLRTQLGLRPAGDTAAPSAAGPIAPPGTVVAVTNDVIVVAAGDGAPVGIVELQPEGRRPMRVRDFLAGHPIAAGMCFTAGPFAAPRGDP
jgi:methionyl-tRNA formyltransferase